MSKYFFFCFFIISNLTFVFSIRSFVGYRHWIDANPSIQVVLDEKDNSSVNVEVKIECFGAEEFQISSDPSFNSSKWRRITSKLSWRLDPSKDIAAVWVVFKRKNPVMQKYEVSTPISYSIDKKNTYKKITSYSNGYIDWTEGKVVLEVVGEKSKDNKARHDISQAQRVAEEKLLQASYEILKLIPLNYYYTVEKFLKMDTVNKIDLNAILNSTQLKEIKHPEIDKVELTGEITFYANENKPGLRFSLKQIHQPYKIENLSSRNTTYDALVIDVRGQDYSLAMYPEITGDNGDPVVSTFYYTNDQKVYVRYMRYLEKSYVIGKSDFLKNNQEKEKNAPQVLYVKAIDVSEDNKSRIIITERYKQLIQSNPKTMYNICNGQMFVLVD